MQDIITPLTIPEGQHLPALYPFLEDCLNGTTPPLLPVPAPNTTNAAQRHTQLTHHFAGCSAPGAALIMATSGTTGTPKGARLSTSALRAACASTHTILGGPGQWLLAVPAYHIIGMQVLLRSLHAGYTPFTTAHTTTFHPSELVSSLRLFLSTSTAPRRYMSLVPSQLDTLLKGAESANPAHQATCRDALAHLAQLDGIVSGGAPLPQQHLTRLRAQGIPIVPGYGSSEVAGGVLFDGHPGPATRITLDPVTHRISIGGDTLADGYVGGDGFGDWFHTQDVGHYNSKGQLIIDGRLDQAINSGGLITLPQPLEDTLRNAGIAADIAIIGLPDQHFGERIAAVAIPHPTAPSPTLHHIQQVVEKAHGHHAIPRELHLVEGFPRTASGKLDRRELVRQILPSSPTQPS